MKLTKKCLECGKQFNKPYKCSLNNWKNRKKSCSIICRRKNLAKQHIGEGNPNWKGGINFDGRYFQIIVHNHPYIRKNGQIYYHRYIVEQKIKRYLLPKEVVHHINGKRTDNRIENLYLFSSNGEHIKYDNRWHKHTIDKSNLI